MGMVTLVDFLPMFCNLQSTYCLIWCIIVTYIYFHMSSLKCMPWQINEVVISTDSPADGDSARTKEEAKNVAPWGHTPCDARQLLKKTKKNYVKSLQMEYDFVFLCFSEVSIFPKESCCDFSIPKACQATNRNTPTCNQSWAERWVHHPLRRRNSFPRQRLDEFG